MSKTGKNTDIVADFAQVLQVEARAVSEAAQRFLEQPEARKAVTESVQMLSRALDRGGRIVVTGIGKSGKIAQKISATFSSTGSPATYLHATEALHGDLGMVTPADAVLALSHTGNTEELVRLLPALKGLGVPIIGIGGNAGSQLAQACNLWLDGSVDHEACPHNLAPTASTTLALAIGDALAVSLMKLRGFEASDFARNHPGGAIGRRLHLKVGDIMQDATRLPLLAPDTPIEQVIEASSRHNLGAVLITGPDSRLLGIITDGDLRRALKHKDRFFQLTAGEVMTAKPVTISADALAYDALEKMEKRTSQIKELPVVDSQLRVLGLVRIHDLVKFF